MNKINIGVLPFSDSLPLYVADEIGLFEKYGLDINLEEFITGNAVIYSIISGKLEGGLVGSIPLHYALEKKLPIKAEFDGGKVNLTNRNLIGLVVKKGSRINKPRELNGKRIAINGYNTNSDFLLGVIAKKYNILENINIITMPTTAMLESIQNNLIDAAIITEPYITRGKSQKIIKILIDSEDIKPSFQSSFICFSKQYSINNKIFINKFYSAYKDAINFINIDPDKSRFILSKRTKIKESVAKKVTLPTWDIELDIDNSIAKTKLTFKEFGIKERGEIEVNNLNVIFQDRTPVHAIKNLNFKIKPLEFVCLLGTTGCGKSTILNAIAGFIKPNSGEVLVDGNPITEPGIDKGIVFQNHAVFPWKSVQKNIEFGLKMKGIGKDNRKVISNKYIELIGLRGFENSYSNQLSGGMIQRVGLARTLANDPLILLMDEPFGALDAQTRQIMQELLLKLWREFPKTIIFVTHDVEEAIFLADRILIMTTRPGTIKKEVPVNIPRPRSNEMIATQEYLDIKKEVFDAIREESIKAIN